MNRSASARGRATAKAGSRVPALLAAAGILVVAACGGRQEDESGGLVLEESVVTRGTLESSVEATGTVEPLRRVEVRSQASGEILTMPVELGDPVERGDLLLEIDPRVQVSELAQAEADLQQAEAELTVAESRLERIQMLRDSGVVTTEELESAIMSHANARSSFVRAENRLELAQEQRDDATVRAPISGIVIEKTVEEGQIVTGTRDLTGGTMLMQLADLANVQVRTLVDESDIGGISPGLPATVTVEAYPDRSFHGEVLQVEPQATVEQNVTMFAVLTRIPNEEGLLKPGMNADVEIVLGRRDDVLKLPNGGVKLSQEARQLVTAIGMDPELLRRRITLEGEEVESEGGPGLAGGGPPSPGELASMPPEERRRVMQSLSEADRRELMASVGGSGGAPAIRRGGAPLGGFPGGFGSGRGEDRQSQQRGSTGPREAFVFLRTPEGGLTLAPILVGLSSWEETEVLAGLEEGDTVVNVPLALVQQSEMLQRFRVRMPGLGGF